MLSVLYQYKNEKPLVNGLLTLLEL